MMNKRCFRCNQMGHISSSCPSNHYSNIGNNSRVNSVWRSTNNNNNNNTNSNYNSNSNSLINDSNANIAKSDAKSGFQLVDIGANLTHRKFERNFDDIMQRASQAGVNAIVVTGTSTRESINAQKLCEQWNESRYHEMSPKLYCTAGVHPHSASGCNEKTMETLRNLTKKKYVVAIGECGLDFNRMYSPQEVQEKWFTEHLLLAKELQFPLFFHERDAHESFVKILKQHRSDINSPMVVHCFTGNSQEIDAYLQLGLHIGFTGTITEKKRGEHLREILSTKKIPLNRLMIETDCPFMVPHNLPTRQRDNEPSYLGYVCKVVAECYGISELEAARETTLTAKTFFNLP